MAQHSPGPWAARDVEDETSARQFWISTKADGHLIAAAEPEGDAEANTRLIAAAPELLEALENLLRAVEGIHVTVGDCNQARAAIAKATGEA